MNAKQKRLILPIAILALGFIALIGAAALIVTGGGEQARASSIGGPFTLTDQNGARVTEASYRGAPSIVFFGYTHCPDVCPTALFDMSEVLKRLPADKRVSALFVTVDPERDTPAALKDYLSSFDPRISGLSGSRPEIDAALKVYRVYSKKQPQENGEYSMDHSAIVYLMDKQGRFVSALNLQSPPDTVAKEIQRLM
ncbi:MAG: SCO1/SenC family protein [Hyphomicrobiales bacterium]|nr:SCO1/SenC family protein [Hyphomicrobiales bacterium]